MRHGDADILRTSARAQGHFHQAVRNALELRDFWRARRDSNSRPSDSKFIPGIFAKPLTGNGFSRSPQ